MLALISGGVHKPGVSLGGQQIIEGFPRVLGAFFGFGCLQPGQARHSSYICPPLITQLSGKEPTCNAGEI